MSHSPYLPSELKDYVSKHEIEENLNTAVNDILRQKPEDPYAFLVDFLEKSCSEKINMSEIKAYEILTSDNVPTVHINCSFTYKMKKYSNFLENYNIVHPDDPRILYDTEESARYNGKGMKKACSILNEKLILAIGNIDCNDLKKFDGGLLDIYNKHEGKIINVTLPISMVVLKGVARLYNTPLYKHIYNTLDLTEKLEMKSTELFMLILQGSKALGSKCKISKFYYIIPKDKTPIEKSSMMSALWLGVRKVLASGKQGEAGLKQLPDMSFICAQDTINDNMKFLDEIINQNGLKDVVKVGLEFAAYDLYRLDHKKYELENSNPKGFLDTNQLIDYYFKLKNDKPSIAYIEDPLLLEDVEGWTKLREKFKDSPVKFGTRKIHATIEKTREFFGVKSSENQDEDEKPFPGPKIMIDYTQMRSGDYPTVSSFFEHLKLIRKYSPSTKCIVADNCTTDSDTFITDLMYGVPGIVPMLGAPTKYERLVKFNRMIEIENESL